MRRNIPTGVGMVVCAKPPFLQPFTIADFSLGLFVIFRKSPGGPFLVQKPQPDDNLPPQSSITPRLGLGMVIFCELSSAETALHKM